MLSITNSKLPNNMLIASPQNSSGSLLTISGPGTIPVSNNAPSISAIVAFSGMPNDNSGIKPV